VRNAIELEKKNGSHLSSTVEVTSKAFYDDLCCVHQPSFLSEAYALHRGRPGRSSTHAATAAALAFNCGGSTFLSTNGSGCWRIDGFELDLQEQDLQRGLKRRASATKVRLKYTGRVTAGQRIRQIL
jgi:hypothetical protein